MPKRSSFATVFASRPLCAAGCGSRTAGNLYCCECLKHDPYEIRRRVRHERLTGLRKLIASGQPLEGTCAVCNHWTGQSCALEIPECSVKFAPLCNCFVTDAR